MPHPCPPDIKQKTMTKKKTTKKEETPKEETKKKETPVKNKVATREEPKKEEPMPMPEETQEGVKYIVPKKVEGFKVTPRNMVQAVYTKKAYENLIEKYKEKNPAKYELKKDELKRKLNAIKQ